MTSKEALENMAITFDTGGYSTPRLGYIDGYFKEVFKEEYDIIKQDLDRLEMLEKFVDIYKYTNQRFTMLVQAPYTDLPHPTLEQELLRVEVLNNDK